MILGKKLHPIVLAVSLLTGPCVAHAEGFDLLTADRAFFQNPAQHPPSFSAHTPSPAQSAFASYRPLTGFQPKDLVRVSVYGEPELSKTYQVDPQGKIYVPLIGAIKVTGRSRKGLEDTLRERLGKGYLVHPKVTVDIPVWPCTENP